MEEFVPINDRVLVRVDSPAQPKTIGLSRPDQLLEKPTTGVVLAVGPDVSYTLKGQRVHWNKYAGKDITVDGEELKLLIVLEINGYFRKQEENA